LFFFQPKKLFFLKGNQIEIHYLYLCDDELESDFHDIINYKLQTKNHKPLDIKQRISKESYLSKVRSMLEHIHRGDIYEANFCMEFYAKNATIDPSNIYQKLNSISKPPLATFFKNNQHYLLCASPERYLRKEENKVISQPIKGTAKRFSDSVLDENSKKELSENPKERSENIMIVDLVRNDLSHTATKGSVEVEELCGVYTFKQVHQMISTVISKVESTIPPIEILQTTFPMGSMTGAPKISAMKIIEELEETKRGLYSGAVGYFTPTHDFDFNVVIRSILYNAQNKYLSFSVGSAITAQSIAEQEYEECLLKAKAMFEVLQ
jgi:para-aminobenzoate synthetase component 1